MTYRLIQTNSIEHQYPEKSLTFYDLCGEDHSIIAEVDKHNQIRSIVLNDSEEVVYDESSHRFAWESLVSFAKMVLSQNEKIERQLESRGVI